jgi:acetyl/propionyl-CoA carboxylase alpha subunit
MEGVRTPWRTAALNHWRPIIAGERAEVLWNETENTVEATVNGRKYTLEKHKLKPGMYWFGWNGQSVEAHVMERDQGYEVSVHGYRIFIEFSDSTKKRRTHGGADDRSVVEVRAPMPGKIVRILLGKGDEVAAQQGIVVMEAMKMQNEIRSPKTGRILELNVAAGDAVDLADLIARVE